MKTLYCTSFCNKPHALETGRPVGHECYILPPKALQAEQRGDVEESIRILEAEGLGPIVHGR
jgi:hypothetical protein